MDNRKNEKPEIKASSKPRSAASDIGKSIMDNYIIPKSKDVFHDTVAGLFSMLGDAAQSALNQAIYGEDRPTRSNSSRTAYSSFYTKPQISTTVNNSSIGTRSSTEIRYIWVQTEEDAKTIVDSMRSNIQHYGKCKVADLYEMVTPKIQTTFQDFKFGWNNPNDISYHKEYTGEHRGEYLIDLTKPIDISNI